MVSGTKTVRELIELLEEHDDDTPVLMVPDEDNEDLLVKIQGMGDWTCSDVDPAEAQYDDDGETCVLLYGIAKIDKAE